MFTDSRIELIKSLIYGAGMVLVLLSASILPMIGSWRIHAREKPSVKIRRRDRRHLRSRRRRISPNAASHS